MAHHRVIGPDDPKYPAIRRRLIWTWLKTILGYLMMGGLIVGALKLFNLHIGVIYGFGLIWVLLPVVMWWYCAKIALYMAKAKPADPGIPEHARLIKLVHEVWLETGLKYEPPVYVADDPSPNAFCTGPIPSRCVVAATRGLFLIGATDNEIKAVFAHEFGHDKHMDVAINSLIGVLSNIFFLIVNAGVDAWLKTIRLFAPRSKKERALPGILGGVVFYAVFWLVGQLTRLIQLFVVRSRESAADAEGALFTGRPCDLVNALEKLVKYVETHRPTGHRAEMWRGLRCLSTIDPLFDAVDPDPKPKGVFGWIKYWWKYLQLTHPPVPERVAALEKMNGGTCPRD